MEQARVAQAQDQSALPKRFERGAFDDIDWGTTIVAACSFLVHFGAVACIWADWMDPVVDDAAVIAGIVESARVVPLPSVEQPAAEPGRSVAPKADSQAPSRAGAEGRGPRGSGPSGSRPSPDEAKAAAIARELRQLDLEVTGVLGSANRATEGVLRGEAPAALLDDAARSAAGAARNAAGAPFGPAGGVVRPGSIHRGLDPIGNLTPTGPMPTGSARPTQAPRGNTFVEPPAETGGGVPDAPRVVGGLSAPFRRCYQRGLDVDPLMKGSVRLVAKIGPNGEVTSVSPTAVVGLSGDVVACLAAKVAGAQFSPPTTGGATLVIPVRLVPQ
jgi:hypothetical protein